MTHIQIKSAALANLNEISRRLRSLGIEAEITIVREGAPEMEYPEIMLYRENYDKAMSDPVAFQKTLVGGLPAVCHIVAEMNLLTDRDQAQELPILQVRPRYSYLTGTERINLFGE